MSAYSWERTKYNQQQRQFKRALLCQSKSTHWLQAVKQRRKEVVGSGRNRRLQTSEPHRQKRFILSVPKTIVGSFFILLKFSEKKPKMIQRNFLSGGENFHLGCFSLEGWFIRWRTRPNFFQEPTLNSFLESFEVVSPRLSGPAFEARSLSFLQAIFELDYMFI